MSRTVTALAGESLDALVWRETGQGAAAVERVLEANPGLAAGADALAEHTAVILPDLPATAGTVDVVQLWD